MPMPPDETKKAAQGRLWRAWNLTSHKPALVKRSGAHKKRDRQPKSSPPTDAAVVHLSAMHLAGIEDQHDRPRPKHIQGAVVTSANLGRPEKNEGGGWMMSSGFMVPGAAPAWNQSEPGLESRIGQHQITPGNVACRRRSRRPIRLISHFEAYFWLYCRVIGPVPIDAALGTGTARGFFP